MANKKEIKTVLLFTPQQLLEADILQVLHIVKDKTINYHTEDLTAQVIRQYFNSLPKPAKEILLEFSNEYLQQTVSGIQSKYKQGRAGIGFEQFYNNAIERAFYDKMVRLKPFLQIVRWYQKKWGKGNPVTAPCSFSPYSPKLQFDVLNESSQLSVEPAVVINGTTYNLKEFNRHHFFIEQNNEYFLLSYKDSQTLSWLQLAYPSQYCNDPQALAENILAKLEEDYTVNRNGFFKQYIVETTPVNQVMLSEISGSFLVLTPQWLYDGFIAEGRWVESFEITRGGAAFVIKRDKQQEAEFVKLLVGLHPNFVKQTNGYYYLGFADAQKKQWFFKAYHLLLDSNIEVLGMDMLKHFRYSNHKPITKVTNENNDSNILALQFSLTFGTEEVPLPALQKMLLSGQKAILLKDGSLGIVGDEWLLQYGTIIKHGKIVNKHIEVARWMALTEEKMQPEQQVLKPNINTEWWQQWQQWQKEEVVLFKVPLLVNATLRQYQQKGFEWMVLLAQAGAGACLADDMGLGKTLQTISFFAYRLEQSANEKYLVVCPSSLVYNWAAELEKFAPHIKTVIYHGLQRNLESICLEENKVVITTYGTLRSDIEKIAAIHFDVAVIDESHNIKNPGALITRAVIQLQATMRIALSGTPVMNNTFDLYAQLSFLLPGMFGSREFFKREYADAIDNEQDVDKIKALQRLTAPFILRRTKEQVATDLPEKTEIILWCEMGGAQKMLYESIRENVRNSVFLDIQQNGISKGKLSVINGMLKLRQVCNSSALFKQEDEQPKRYESIKLDMLAEELQQIVHEHKALVFSQFTSMLDLIEARLQKEKIVFCRLDGSTPIEKRQQLVNNFQQIESPEKVFLISLKAGNAGLNLTAADYVFIIDPWWNTAVEQQAIDRTHRIGQLKNVFAYKLICKDTIEEKIIQLQQRKKKLAAELIGEEEGFVKALTEDDIDFLFN